ncbi:hypothetical protein LuPra_00997 [Luteitalea pratensis]|uniref:DUF4157 domain-containing protein n=1 Tax=Luteitalea pratensis TaxID=1855912 RepID=A0A143PHC6_LUTPR|nr:hypothetical protein [Luteitalea pratensis]AMY07816.1 hypothetical protein LuPra_00997 [Luteitalea pratensis]
MTRSSSLLLLIILMSAGVQARPCGDVPKLALGTTAIAGISASGARMPGKSEWPCRLGVPRPIIPRVQELWMASRTFRQQCIRLAESDVTIAVGFSLMLPPNLRAASKILKRDGRVFYVSTTLRDDQYIEEDLPHELEHAIEQIEGRDLATDAAAGRGAWPSALHGYETVRARAAARQVREEVRAARCRGTSALVVAEPAARPAGAVTLAIAPASPS